MDQEVHRPARQIETTMVNGPSRRSAVVPWRVHNNPPPSWWRRLVSIVSGDVGGEPPAELETRSSLLEAEPVVDSIPE